MRKILLFSLFILLFAIQSFALPSPQARVEEMVNSVLGVLQQAEVSEADKKAAVSGTVQQYLNVESISRRTLGTYWDGATEEQRQQFSTLFIRILEGTYLNRMEGYSGGKVKYLKQRVKGNKAIVDTLVISKELEIPVQYKMIYADGNWQIFDLVLEGISLVRNYRSSYGEIIRRSGYDGLLALMDEKVRKMESPM
jgi:phospholipid transport system substrate-binding protein